MTRPVGVLLAAIALTGNLTNAAENDLIDSAENSIVGIADSKADSIAAIVAETPVAIKTNLLYDATLTVNLGAEFRLAPRWSLDVSGNYNGWSISDKTRWKHWLVQPELRYWTRHAMQGHFFAGHVFGGQYNVTYDGERRQGWGIGLGVGYGYAWRLSRHWGIEAEIAVGYARHSYDKYPCAECGRKIKHSDRNYVGPTKAAVNLVYYFGGKKKEQAPVVPVLPVIDEVIEAVDTVVPVPTPDFRFILVDVPQTRVRSENLTGETRIQFAVNSTKLDPGLDSNDVELRALTAKMDSICNDLDMLVVSVDFTGYASPDGPYAGNDRLASGRVVALRDYLQRECKLPADIMSVSAVPEDWNGLRAAIAASDLDDKAELLDIIDSSDGYDSKEAALRRHSDSWKYLKENVLPDLRRTRFRIDYEHRYEERETQTLAEVNKAITAGDVERAADLLVDMPSSAEADYAHGLVAALRGNYNEALAWLNRAAGRGVTEAKDAIRQIEEFMTKIQ